MLKAVIFDMDGVIIDSEPLHYDFEQTLFSKLNISVEKDYHNSFVGTTSHYMWNKLKDKYQLSQSIEELVSESRTSFMTFLKKLEKIEAIQGVTSLIQELHHNDIKLAIASSSPLDMISFIVTTLNLDEYFSILVTGDNVERSKPNPDIFLLAAEKLSVSPNECIVIEDSGNGVKAAKAAGMKCIGYKNPNSGNQDISIADIIIDNYASLSLATFKTLVEVV